MGALARIGILMAALFATASYTQEEEIVWSPQFRLNWSDFRAKPEPNSRIAAVTASGISYSFSSMARDDFYEVEYVVSTSFYPQKSWYQPHMCDELVLSHEQLHFDIAELFSRKMRRELAKMRFTENVKAEIDEVYRQTLKELAEFQNRYDEETNYSMNRTAQLRWNQEIKKALTE